MPTYIQHIKSIGDISSKVFEECARVILSLLILVILITISWAVVKTILELRVVFSKDIHDALQLVMVNAR